MPIKTLTLEEVVETKPIKRERKITPKPVPVPPPEEIEEVEYSITPEEPCCNKLCQDLNQEIEDREFAGDLTKTRVVRLSYTEEGKTYYYYDTIKIPYISPYYDYEALTDLRRKLKKKNVCKCFETTKETKGIETFIPPGVKNEAISKSEKDIPERTKRVTRKLTAPFYPQTLRMVYKKDIPKIPTSDDCCKDTCKIINSKILELKKSLNELDIIAKKREKYYETYRSPRYTDLVYRSHMLEQYRHFLKDRNICRCIE